MLTIRYAQISVLERVAEQHFREVAAEYLNRTVPEVCSRMTPQDVAQSIDYAVDACRLHGFTREVDILRYLNLMYVFGFGFEYDPKFSWARTILEQLHLKPAARLDWLCSRGIYEAGRQGRQG